MLPTPRQRKDARPGELIEAALQLFSEKGFAATRSEEVAARAGVSKGTLYLYFNSKEALFKAAVRSHLGTLIMQGRELVEGFEGSSGELLRTLLGRWWRNASTAPAPAMLKILMTESCAFPELATIWADEIVLPLQELLGHIVRRGIGAGELRALPIDQVIAAFIAPVLLIAMEFHSQAMASACLRTVDLDARVETQLDILLGGICLPHAL